jgi:hypothetical protein
VAKQTSFVDLGVVRIALKAMATHSPNVEGNLADEVKYTHIYMLLGCWLITLGRLFFFVIKFFLMYIHSQEALTFLNDQSMLTYSTTTTTVLK